MREEFVMLGLGLLFGLMIGVRLGSAVHVKDCELVGSFWVDDRVFECREKGVGK